MYSGDKPAILPWKSGEYVLKPKEPLATTIVLKAHGCSMTVSVPTFHPEFWQRFAFEACPDPPLVCSQTGPKEFTTFSTDDIRNWRAHFEANGIGEEHEIRALPAWEHQASIVQEAFGRPMVPDSRPPSNGRIFVKSANGTPPDPTFARVMKYTLGYDPTEHAVRIHGGDTPDSIRTGLKHLHPGISPDKRWFNGAIFDESDAVGDWWSTTGTSPFVVKWTLEAPMQNFECWFPSGLRNIGSFEVDGRPVDEVWGEFRLRHPDLQEFGAYRMFLRSARNFMVGTPTK
jgi:hypothetical protein